METESVEYKEATSIKVGRYLLSSGFDLADSTGKETRLLTDVNELGILWRNPKAKPDKFLFGLIKREPRRIFLGRVWFDNDARGASEQNWVFDVWGRKNVDLAKQLAEKMARTFGVKVTVSLVREDSCVEVFYYDRIF